MKICYFHHCNDFHDIRLIKNLAKTNQVIVLSYYKKKINIPFVNIVQVNLPRPLISYPIAAIITKTLLKKIKSNILFATYISTYGFYAAYSGIKPFVLNTMGSDVFIDPKKPIINKITQYVLSKATAIVTDSNYGLSKLIDLKADEHKIYKIHWGVDINSFSPVGQKINLGWNDKTIIICTRRHDPIYGMTFLIDAIPKVIRKYPDARFLIIGTGTEHKKLINNVVKLGITKYVRFIERIENNELPNYLRASNIYISPSLSDGTSVSMLEAMASGLPIIATDIPSNREWIKNTLIPQASSQSLASSILDLISDKKRQQIQSEENRKIIIEKGNLDDSIKQLNTLFNIYYREK